MASPSSCVVKSCASAKDSVWLSGGADGNHPSAALVRLMNHRDRGSRYLEGLGQR
jgi:hypothetical protein